MIYHLSSAPFLYLHHRHCQSQDIIFIRLIIMSITQGLPLKIKNVISSKTLTLTHLILHPPCLTTLPWQLPCLLWPFGDRTWTYYVLPFGQPLWFAAGLVNKLVRLIFEWRSRNSEITICWIILVQLICLKMRDSFIYKFGYWNSDGIPHQRTYGKLYEENGSYWTLSQRHRMLAYRLHRL